MKISSMLAHSSSFLHIFAPQKHILVCWVVKLSSKKNDINYFEIKNYVFFLSECKTLLYIVVVYWSLNIFCDFTNKRCGCGLVIESGITQSKKGLTNDSWRCSTLVLGRTGKFRASNLWTSRKLNFKPKRGRWVITALLLNLFLIFPLSQLMLFV